jgi:hypothetical protein
VIPNECEVTIEHALVHLNSAMDVLMEDGFVFHDKAQVVHDVSIAKEILNAIIINNT